MEEEREGRENGRVGSRARTQCRWDREEVKEEEGQ